MKTGGPDVTTLCEVDRALVTGANITDSAYALAALGVRDALNLDGGGTSAMWIGGSYKVGPGRLLPNAIVLTKP